MTLDLDLERIYFVNFVEMPSFLINSLIVLLMIGCLQRALLLLEALQSNHWAHVILQSVLSIMMVKVYALAKFCWSVHANFGGSTLIIVVVHEGPSHAL